MLLDEYGIYGQDAQQWYSMVTFKAFSESTSLQMGELFPATFCPS
jgi:hypothetical protein